MTFKAWRRIPEAGACSFCLMLATRGAVYSSARTAGEGNAYHRHCRCDAALETDFNSRKDVYIDPSDANQTITVHNRTGRVYQYDLRKYGVKNPPDLPAQPAVTRSPAGQVSDDILPTARRRQMTAQEALDGANPLNGKTNCVNCVASYELRRRGLEVTALKSRPQSSDDMMLRLFGVRDGSGVAKVEWEKAPPLTPEVRKSTGWQHSFDPIGDGDPDGARYFVQWEWGPRSGHIVCAERRNGVTVFIDPQTGEEWVGVPKGRRAASRVKWIRVDQWDMAQEAEEFARAYLKL